jgi:hypothetical protein
LITPYHYKAAASATICWFWSSPRHWAPRSAWCGRYGTEIIPRSAHVIHAQILLSIVGAMIIVVVAELRGSSPEELHYEVTVPFKEKIKKLSKLIRSLDGHSGPGGTSVEWEIKKYKTLRA